MARYRIEIKYGCKIAASQEVWNLPQNFWGDIAELARHVGVRLRVTEISWFGLRRKVVFQKAWKKGKGQ